YYYNGEGYDDSSIIKTYAFIEGITDPTDVAGLLLDSGFHYGAASANWREMWGSDFSLSVFYIENFSSFSGMVKPSISWGGLDNIDISLSASRMFGDAGEEYSMAGNIAAVSLGVSIGGTSF
ncbi:MAG: hypothetical protein KAH95_05080, partial [Spirochaetales bacterium]|nr:hypothetical protein [Spirochaetales bacterium]